MSIDIKGSGRFLSIHGSTWNAVQQVAREYGCTLQYENRADEERGWGDYGDYVIEKSARSFARALFKAIHAIEAGRASKRLVKLAKEARVGILREIADLAVVGRFYVD